MAPLVPGLLKRLRFCSLLDVVQQRVELGDVLHGFWGLHWPERQPKERCPDTVACRPPHFHVLGIVLLSLGLLLVRPLGCLVADGSDGALRRQSLRKAPQLHLAVPIDIDLFVQPSHSH